MQLNVLMVTAANWDQARHEVLEYVSAIELRGKKLLADGQVLAERIADNWQSRLGWHGRLSVAGDLRLSFEAPAYQYLWERPLPKVELVGGTLWSSDRELLAFYDANTDRWRDADNQQWAALHFTAPIEPGQVVESSRHVERCLGCHATTAEP